MSPRRGGPWNWSWRPRKFRCAACGRDYAEVLALHRCQEKHERDRQRAARGGAGSTTRTEEEDTMKTATIDPLLTVRDVARLLGLHPSTLYDRRHVMRKALPWRRIGERALRLRRSDLDAYLDKRRAA